MLKREKREKDKERENTSKRVDISNDVNRTAVNGGERTFDGFLRFLYSLNHFINNWSFGGHVSCERKGKKLLNTCDSNHNNINSSPKFTENEKTKTKFTTCHNNILNNVITKLNPSHTCISRLFRL